MEVFRAKSLLPDPCSVSFGSMMIKSLLNLLKPARINANIVLILCKYDYLMIIFAGLWINLEIFASSLI